MKKEDDDDDDEGTQVVTKFITEEGSELQLTAQQKAQLLEQLQGQEGQLSDNVVMVLDASFEHAGTESDVNNASTEGMDVDQQEEEEIITAERRGDDSTEDEMASIENTSADEDSQQVAATNIHEHDTVGDGDKADANKADANKELLISALEGDWSGDEDEQQHQQQPLEEQQPPVASKKTKSSVSKVEQPIPAPAAARPKRSSKKVEADTIKIEKGTNNDSAKTILDDWEKFDEEREKSVNEEKVDTDGDGDGDEADVSIETETANTESKNGNNGGGTNNKSEKKQQLDQKSEIKESLINDWGDEEEEAY